MSLTILKFWKKGTNWLSCTSTLKLKVEKCMKYTGGLTVLPMITTGSNIRTWCLRGNSTSSLDSHPWTFGLIARFLMDMVAKTVQPFQFQAKSSCSELSCGKTLPMLVWLINSELTKPLSVWYFGAVLFIFTCTRMKVYVFGVGKYCILLLINCICPLEIQKNFPLGLTLLMPLKMWSMRKSSQEKTRLSKNWLALLRTPLKRKPTGKESQLSVRKS